LADKALPNAAPVQSSEPATKKSDPVRLVVKRDRRADVSRIVIPKWCLGAGEQPAGAAAPGEAAAAPPTQSIVAGIALSLAVVAGFFALRRGKRKVAAAVAAGTLLLGALGFWAASATADVAPPPDERGPKIVIEIVEEGEAVTLTLGRGALLP
jgi:hypothetical protein